MVIVITVLSFSRLKLSIMLIRLKGTPGNIRCIYHGAGCLRCAQSALGLRLLLSIMGPADKLEQKRSRESQPTEPPFAEDQC